MRDRCTYNQRDHRRNDTPETPKDRKQFYWAISHNPDKTALTYHTQTYDKDVSSTMRRSQASLLTDWSR
jgi:hypothetical protein